MYHLRSAGIAQRRNLTRELGLALALLLTLNSRLQKRTPQGAEGNLIMKGLRKKNLNSFIGVFFKMYNLIMFKYVYTYEIVTMIKTLLSQKVTC